MCHWIQWNTKDIQTILINKTNLIEENKSQILPEQFPDEIEIEFVVLIHRNQKHVYQ